jgi:hypothetical protein
VKIEVTPHGDQERPGEHQGKWAVEVTVRAGRFRPRDSASKPIDPESSEYEKLVGQEITNCARTVPGFYERGCYNITDYVDNRAHEGYRIKYSFMFIAPMDKSSMGFALFDDGSIDTW